MCCLQILVLSSSVTITSFYSVVNASECLVSATSTISTCSPWTLLTRAIRDRDTATSSDLRSILTLLALRESSLKI